MSEEFDLSSLSYDQFIAFFFDRPAPDSNEHLPSFPVERAEWEFSRPEVAVTYMTSMCKNFAAISREYSLGQLNQALWAIIGLDFDLVQNLWDNSVSLRDRIDCIRSMYVVYSDFVAKSEAFPLENIFDMWWDLIAHNFWSQRDFFDRSALREGRALKRIDTGEVSKLDSDSRALLDAMFETLRRILDLPDRRAQKFALHGLGHIHHPGVPDLVQGYIDKNRDGLTAEDLKWMEQCRDGKVL